MLPDPMQELGGCFDHPGAMQRLRYGHEIENEMKYVCHGFLPGALINGLFQTFTQPLVAPG
jgi:hypothetical protein